MKTSGNFSIMFAPATFVHNALRIPLQQKTANTKIILFNPLAVKGDKFDPHT